MLCVATHNIRVSTEDQVNVYWDVEVQPGQSVTATFTAPVEPGEYVVTCGIQGHLEAGMSAKLMVVAGG